LITFTSVILSYLVSRAYGVPRSQVFGPAWLDTDFYDVVAKLPPNTKEEDVDRMLRNFLSERFHLRAHRERRDLSVYLLVAGKSGSKLKEAARADPQADYNNVGIGKDGFVDLRPGVSQVVGGGMLGEMRVSARMQSLPELAQTLERLVGRPVVDQTGLSGTYDYKFKFYDPRFAADRGAQTDAADPEPDVFEAVSRQLGLELKSGKALLDCLVVDTVVKTPSD
jgi:uncharacterized protein (TIGR03435 family)